MSHKICIVVPTKNQDKYLRESIDSILNQTMKSFHLIIVDNNSTDNTDEILKEYKIKYKNSEYPKVTITKELNPGTGAALNKAINIDNETTKCEYFTWWASDNVLENNALYELNNFLDREKDVDVVYANMDIRIFNNGELTKIKNLKEEVKQEWNVDKIFNHYFLGCIWLFRREIMKKSGEWYIHEPCEDYEHIIRCVFAKANFKFYDLKLGWFRRHTENLSAKLKGSGYPEKLVERLNAIRKNNNGDKYIKFINWKYNPTNYISNKDVLFEDWLSPKEKEKEKEISADYYTKIYTNNSWGGKESVSGKGSDLEQARRIIRRLPILFTQYNIKSILDAPCGDLNWMQYVLNSININYTGIDNVSKLIEKNKSKYPNLKFEVKDIIHDPLNYRVDLILCRDFFVHLGFPTVKNIIKKFYYTGSKYLLTTNFLREDRRNQKEINIQEGISWRTINLMSYPFNLPAPILTINERCTEKDKEGTYEDKSLCLWSLNDIAKSWKLETIKPIIEVKPIPVVKEITKKEILIETPKKEVVIEKPEIVISQIVEPPKNKEIRPIVEVVEPTNILDNKDTQIVDKTIELKDEWHLSKIPKIMHFYWGNKTLPYLRYLTVKSFRKYNPDWEIRFYYTSNRSKVKTWVSREHDYEIDEKNDYFNELKKIDKIQFLKIDDKEHSKYPEVFKSDLLRWSLLCNEGGFWSDMDILYLKSMNECYFNKESNKDIDTILQLNDLKETYHTIGFLAGSELNKFWYYVKEKALKTNIDFNNYQSLGVCLLNNEFPNLKVLIEKFKESNFLSFKKDLLYSYYPLERLENALYKKDGIDYTNDETIGIHWYGGYKKSGEICNKLKHNNINKFKISICDFIKRVNM